MSNNYLETIKALISVGYGWGVLPEIMLTDDSLVRLPVKGVNLVRRLALNNLIYLSLQSLPFYSFSTW